MDVEHEANGKGFTRLADKQQQLLYKLSVMVSEI